MLIGSATLSRSNLCPCLSTLGCQLIQPVRMSIWDKASVITDDANKSS